MHDYNYLDLVGVGKGSERKSKSKLVPNLHLETSNKWERATSSNPQRCNCKKEIYVLNSFYKSFTS